jgi:hypothetical protein
MANDGWIEWHGDDHSPIANEAIACVRFRNGETGAGAKWNWLHDNEGGEYEIVAYKVAQPTDTSAADLIAQFPQGVHLEITVVFPGEYRIGYRYQNVHYLPGTPSYYPLEEALQRCLDAFNERFLQ